MTHAEQLTAEEQLAIPAECHTGRQVRFTDNE